MQQNIDRIRMVTIEEVIQETPTVKTFIFQDRLASNAKPGEFLMVWIPRVEELPMSVMIDNKKNYAAVTVRKHGLGSTSLFNKTIGDLIGIRGPYGNKFKISSEYKNILLVGGGTGLVPLLRLLAYYVRNSNILCTFIMGSKSKDEVLFEKRVKMLLSGENHNIVITTEDGSYGRKGFPTDVMEEIISKNKFDAIYTCGPELMMKQVYLIGKKNSINVQASIERYMKCGIGICASCCIGDKLVCKDGTIFNSRQIDRFNEFGKSYRDKSGKDSYY